MPTYITPDGAAQKVLSDPTTLDTAWVQPSDFPDIQADSTKSAMLTSMILASCAAINRMCNRKFNQQQTDTIIPDTGLFYRDYKTVPLWNTPIVSVDAIWLQVVNTFAVVALTFIQIDYTNSWVKILPTFQTYVQTTLPVWALTPSTNLWIRATTGYSVDYSSGHSTNEVPWPVRMATQLYVRYLYASVSFSAGLKSFSTQTYSQTSAAPKDDPMLGAIENMLAPYKLIWVAF